MLFEAVSAFFGGWIWPPAEPSQPAWMDKSIYFFPFFLKLPQGTKPLEIFCQKKSLVKRFFGSIVKI